MYTIPSHPSSVIHPSIIILRRATSMTDAMHHPSPLCPRRMHSTRVPWDATRPLEGCSHAWLVLGRGMTLHRILQYRYPGIEYCNTYTCMYTCTCVVQYSSTRVCRWQKLTFIILEYDTCIADDVYPCNTKPWERYYLLTPYQAYTCTHQSTCTYPGTGT